MAGEPGIAVRRDRPRYALPALLLGRGPRILHLHFFDELTQRHGRIATALRSLLFLALLEALRLRGTAAQMEGDLEASRRDLGQAVAELREIGDQVHLGEALRARGFAEVFGGSLGDAEWFLNEADAVWLDALLKKEGLRPNGSQEAQSAS